MTFQETGLSSEIIKSVSELGFINPTPIQEKVISQILQYNRDIIALSQTGTGKTAAYGLPILQHIDVKNHKPQALVLCPTRELCIQISNDLIDYSKYLDNLKIAPVYGGSSIETQIRALKQGVQIIVATPGRLVDLIDRKVAKLETIKYLVLDEADEMLNMGFSESINTIMGKLSEERTNLLFSATMPPEISKIAKKYMVNPVELTVGTKNSGADNVKHYCYTVHAKDKYETLKRLIDYYPETYGIIFCRTRAETQEIADRLIADGFNSEPLHGDLSQQQRDIVMSKFRSKTIKLLVATDIAARGIDVDDLTHIFNYNLPDDIDAYTHRSGRTGRAGKAGVSIAITNLKEKYRIKQIEGKIGKQFIQSNVPSGKEVCEKQLFHLIERIEHIEIEHEEINPYLPIINKKLGWLDKEDLIKRLVSVEFNRFLQFYKDAVDLNEKESSFKKDKSKSDKKSSSKFENSDFVKIFINLGKADEFYPGLLIEMLNKTNRRLKFQIGKIELYKKHTIFEIDSANAGQIIKSMSGMMFDDRQLVLKIDNAPSKSNEKDNDRKRSRRK
ncbi:DEAD/DEAH box helicase [Candidatus Kapaibacterium sp.]